MQLLFSFDSQFYKMLIKFVYFESAIFKRLQMWGKGRFQSTKVLCMLKASHGCGRWLLYLEYQFPFVSTNH